MNTLKASYWTDQKTGEPIGPLYSWNEIREMQLNELMSGMNKEKSTNPAHSPSSIGYKRKVVESFT